MPWRLFGLQLLILLLAVTATSFVAHRWFGCAVLAISVGPGSVSPTGEVEVLIDRRRP